LIQDERSAFQAVVGVPRCFTPSGISVANYEDLFVQKRLRHSSGRSFTEVRMQSAAASPRPVWRERFSALRNLPPVLRLVWDAAPAVVAGGLILRVASALIPLATLWVSKWIIDLVVAAIKHPSPIPDQIWWLLGAEFGLAGLNQVLSRTIDYTDARLADEFTREVSLRVMEHAARLDLASFEDPAFHDKLERARLQATDRIGMLNAMGRLLLQSITLVTLSAGVIAYSPWLFLLLVVCVIPAFAGESHFAFLGYSLAHGITPIRRELDYLRILGSSKDSAKEVKVFGLEDTCATAMLRSPAKSFRKTFA
jgi:ATP-binding cassette subfamily B protein